ncbi:MAG: hypothetical protein JZU47_07580 [Prolixibacteraceae bacterium]|nr:hypothetical protein [Prolixibacteraceae bacterium]
MKKLILAFLILALCAVSGVSFAQETPALKVKVSVSPEMKSSFIKGGRIILYLTRQKHKEPRNGFDIVVGVTPKNWDPSTDFVLDTRNPEVITAGTFSEFLNSTDQFYYQVLYKQNPDDGQENVPGNMYSQIDSTRYTPNANLSLKLQKIIPPFEIVKHKFVKPVVIQSNYLTEFSGRPRYLRASVLLPSNFFDHPEKSYPICYRVPGLNGRYDGINGMMRNKDFTDWWFSGNAPQIIYVFMDSQGPFGDTYLVDSENNGPCGKALTEELIPEIEKLVHYKKDSGKRFLAGASTGGWVALGLQIFYPDFFDGTWSYSPDPVEFEHFGLIDIYHDESAFYSRYGYLQPESRTTLGDMKWTMKECIEEENVLGKTGNYLISGGQFGAYNAVFGPKGKDGLPSLMFDPITGKIDHAVAAQWEKYDLKKVLQKNWATLGPKLQGKIWVWTGDMDGLFSNVATRFLKMYLDKTENPKSDAKISFTPMAGHCQEWSDKAVVTMVAEKAAGK